MNFLYMPELSWRYDYVFALSLMAAVAALLAVLLIGGISLLDDSDPVDPTIIAALDADYYIDYENGTIPLRNLPPAKFKNKI